MARKHDLRRQHAGMILNFTSKKQETTVAKALRDTLTRLQKTFTVQLDHKPQWVLSEIVTRLSSEYPDVPFATPLPTSYMRPDGGILSILDRDGAGHPVLIVEVKNQGTNDERIAEGLPRQAMGNAIERLGKNVIGFRTAMLPEGIMPFVCFGYGCDFQEGSSIRDRVITVAMFGPLNEVNVVPHGEAGQFPRGSYFFREKEWSKKEMADVLFDVASRSIHFYFAKYGSAAFETAT
ncbi:MAG: EcoRI family type II restriction endonuclease [Solirubrobacteraceae bacterium]